MGAHPFIHEEGIKYSLWKQPMFWRSGVHASLQPLCALAAVLSDSRRRRDGAAGPGHPKGKQSPKMGACCPIQGCAVSWCHQAGAAELSGLPGCLPLLLSTPFLCAGSLSSSPVLGQPGSAAGAGLGFGDPAAVCTKPVQPPGPVRSLLRILRALLCSRSGLCCRRSGTCIIIDTQLCVCPSAL